LQPATPSIDLGIPSQRELIREIHAFLLDKMLIQVESTEMDLLESGVLDSVAQVNLLLHIEEHFRLHLPMDNLEIDSFRSVAKIAELVASYSGPQMDSPVSIDGAAEGSHNNGNALTHVNASELEERTNLIREIQALFEETSSIRVEAETNLFETGVLDSMTLVQFILNLEEKFVFHLPMEDIEVDSFSSVTKIAELVANRAGSSSEPKSVEY
jgi:D-alanine--poly(phosphoribitol) ligase subunit 2